MWNPIFETERLIVTDWNPDEDTADAFEMYRDPEVVRFLGRSPTVVASLDEMEERLRTRLAAAPTDGTGYWAIHAKDDSRIVGAVIVKYLPDGEGNPTPDLEVGWHLKRSEWGKGYATEAGRGGIAYAFDVLGAQIIHAVVYNENARSIAVTRRLGMSHVGTTDKYYGVTVELFELRTHS